MSVIDVAARAKVSSVAYVSFVLLAAANCGHSTASVGSRPQCDTGFVANWSPDSSVAICLPVSFGPALGATGSHVRWERGRLESVERAWLSISVDAADAADVPWPPHLASAGPCNYADCTTADSVEQHRDTLASGTLFVETGLMSGGFPGFRRQPALVAGLTLPRGRVWVNGLATKAATLDTLHRALLTARFRE
jgi:hypothetical protein